MRPEAPAWVRDYVGIEFRERGRDRAGLDCWGLIRLVYGERYAIALPSLADRYSGVGDSAAIRNLVDHETLTRAVWQPLPVAHAREGDVLLVRASDEWHCGVMVARHRMLHAQRGACSNVARIDSWPRAHTVWRYCGPVSLIARPAPIAGDAVRLALPAGGSIEEILAAAGVRDGPGLRVWINDREVPREAWRNVRPRPGRRVVAAAVPAGEGAGKTALRLVATIAIIAAAVAAPHAMGAAWVAANPLGASLVSAGVSVVGLLALNALIPPPKPRLSAGAGELISPSITGSGNSARPWGAVPVILGRHRITPDYAAAPYTEIVGDDQYLRMLFCCGYGPLEISDIRIGETPITEFQGVELEIREGRPDDEPMRLYPHTPIELALSVQLSEEAGWVSRTSATDADELSIDVTWPTGLVRFGDDGSRHDHTVEVEVEFRPVGAPDWRRVNETSPDVDREFDLLFREPESRFGGHGTHVGQVAWGLAFPNAKPAYLPTSDYSWEATGYIYAPQTGTYRFGVDGSDAIELVIDDRVVAAWHGEHGPHGTPDFSAHNAEVVVQRGWRMFRLRMEARSTTGAAAVGWIPPGTGSWAIVPATNLSSTARAHTGGLFYRWYDTSVYRSTIVMTANRSEQLRRALTWAVPRGQYDVRLRRVTPESTDDRIVDRVFWTALRTIRHQDPVRIPGLARIALRIKATDQLNGVVDTFNCVAQSILPDWDGEAWLARATSNPASCYRAVWQGPANARPIADERLDLAELQAWHAACAAKGLECNGVIDTPGTLADRLDDVAATGRARRGMRDGLHSVVRDRVQAAPVQIFTARNTTRYQGRRIFTPIPHALRVQYRNRDRGWERDERVVLADGYQIDGLDAWGQPAPTYPPATLIETLETWGVDEAEQAFRHGRYHLAAALLRSEIHEIGTDVEHLICSAGDLVLAVHDVPMFGLAAGRILGLIDDDDGNLLGVVVDEAVEMVFQRSYVLRVRLETAEVWTRSIVTVPGAQTELRFSQPVPPTAPARPAVGDLWTAGELGRDSRELIVSSIEVDRDLGATLRLVDYAPAIHEADEGEIPPYDSGITFPPRLDRRPSPPVIESIRSDDYVMIRGADGTLRPRMLITLRPPSSFVLAATHAQVRTRLAPTPPGAASGPWIYHPITPIEGRQVSVLDVEQGQTYELALRTIAPNGATSIWVHATHTVVGKVRPPPNVEAFDVVRASDGTRRYSWRFGLVPPDIAGVVLRYGQPGAEWSQMSALHDGILQSSPYELNVPPAGTWRFGIRSLDTSGNLSTGVLYIVRTLGIERLEGVVFSEDAAAAGWPGTKEYCFVAGDILEATDLATWETLGAMGAGTWDQYTRWNWAPRSPLRYTHTLDAGLVFEFSPDAIVAGEGQIEVEAAWSVNGSDFTPLRPLAEVRDVAVTARYLRVRVTVSASAEFPIPVLSRLLVLMRAESKIVEHDDLDTSTLSGRIVRPGDVFLPVPAGRFAVIRGVQVTFNGMGPAWSWELVERDPLVGPRVRLYNAQGVLSHAIIDAIIRGI